MLVPDFGAIVRLDASGNLVRTYDTPAGNQCWLGDELDPDGTSFWASDWCASSVTRFGLKSGNVIESYVADDRGFMVKQIAIPGNIFPIVVTNTATVEGAGESNTGNNSANDPTTINPPPQPVPSLNSIANSATGGPGIAAGSIATVYQAAEKQRISKKSVTRIMPNTERRPTELFLKYVSACICDSFCPLR